MTHLNLTRMPFPSGSWTLAASAAVFGVVGLTVWKPHYGHVVVTKRKRFNLGDFGFSQNVPVPDCVHDGPEKDRLDNVGGKLADAARQLTTFNPPLTLCVSSSELFEKHLAASLFSTVIVSSQLHIKFENMQGRRFIPCADTAYAFIVAHEIGHAAAKHSAERFLWFRHDVERLQRKEYEADKIAAVILGLAGYDARLAVPLMRHLGDPSQNGVVSYDDSADTHPSPLNRAVALEKWLDELEAMGGAKVFKNETRC